MRTRGLGRRRYAALAAIVLALCMAAPELAAPAGAVAARSTVRSESRARNAARSAREAKPRPRKTRRRKRLRPMSVAKKRALLERYITAHPGVVAAHARRPNVTLAKKLQAAAYRRAHPKKRPKKKPAAKPKRKPAPAKKKATTAKKKKKKATGVSGWQRDAMLLGGVAVAVLAVFLIGSSVLSGPRSRARARARRRERALVTR